MWTRHRRLTAASLPTARPRTRSILRLERLEDRDVPAVNIVIDYAYDTSGFFSDPARQAILQQAANLIGSQLDTPLAAIYPSGSDTWSETFQDPSTGGTVTVSNPGLAANTIVLYAGGRALGGGQVSIGGMGGFTANGDQNWLNSISTRGPDGRGYWGGLLAFDTTTNWYFGSSASGLGSNQIDFLTCASHEIMNAIGVGTSTQWFDQVSNNTFTGPNAESVYGGPVPVTWGGGAELNDVTVNGVPAVKNLNLSPGVRTAPLTALDWALIKDVGWGVGSSSVTTPPSGGDSGGSSTTTPPVSSPPVSPSPVSTPSASSSNSLSPTSVLLSGPTDGSVQAYISTDGSTLTPFGSPITPFPGWTGVIRSTVGDFFGNGDIDYAFARGPGGPGQVVVFDATTGHEVIGPTTVLGGFTGGVYLAAGDIDRSGKDVLAVSADAGGSTRIEILGVQNGQLVDEADFIAFGDSNFRGGARIAFGDVSDNGIDDLIVGAGIGGAPRVSIYTGQSLLSGTPTNLVPDFYALDPNLRTGVFVTAADLTGSGYADIIYSTGNGGGPRVEALSGQELVDNPGVNVLDLPPLANFFALDPNNRDGLRIVARDVQGTGRADLIVATGAISGAEVRIIPYSQMVSGDPTTPILYPLGDTPTADGIYLG